MDAYENLDLVFAFIRIHSRLKFINPRFLLRKVIKDGGVHREVSDFNGFLANASGYQNTQFQKLICLTGAFR